MAELSNDDRACLLERLATFTGADPSRFVSARIVLPAADYFPEPWEHSENGVRVLAQRMLSHAGLGDLRAEVQLGDSAIAQGRRVFETETALLTIERGVVSFACDLLGRADDAAAVQLLVRDPDAERLEEILAALPRERRDEVIVEMARLQRGELIDVLGLPPPETWDEEADLPLPPLPDDAPPDRATSDDEPRRPAFRLRGDHRALGAFVGTGLACLVELGLNVAGVPRAHWNLEFIAGVACSAAIGLAVGSRRRFDACSNCGRRVAEDLARCPACARPIVGRIVHRDERLEAEERWTAKSRGEPE